MHHNQHHDFHDPSSSCLRTANKQIQSSQSHSSHQKTHKSKHKPGIYNFRQGICTHVPVENILAYVQRFTKILYEQKDIPKLQSVQKWRKQTHNNSIMRMYFQGALDQIPSHVSSLEQAGRVRPGILHGYSTDKVLDLINVVAQTPPCFLHSEFCGVPINALLIDIIDTSFGKCLFSLPEINNHLKAIFNDYARMLKSKKSLIHLNSDQGGWLSEQALKEADYSQIICDTSAPHYGFNSWHDWFIRIFKEGARPVEEDQSVIVHAAENYPLTNIELPYINLKRTDKFWLKENRYSLYDMFEAEKMGVKHIIDESFVGGTLYQGYLSPWCYHWWHSPVSGKIIHSYLLQGSYFLQNPSLDLSGANNYDNSQAFLSCVSARHVFIIDTQNPLIGRVAIIAIGMVQVSSCIAVVNEGDYVKKGEQIGRFQFGGSSHVIVFDRRANLEFNPSIYQRENRGGFQISVRQKIKTRLAKIIPLKKMKKDE